MYGLNFFSLLVFIGLNIFAAALCRCTEETRGRYLRMLCLALLGFNVCRYALGSLMNGHIWIPVEFSTFSYFAVPTIILSGRKKLRSFAVYCGIMAGLFYYLTMIFAGGPIYHDYPPYDIYLAMCCHGILYLCGMVGLRTEQLEQADSFKLLEGVAYIALSAHVFRPLTNPNERLFIYELLDGRYVRELFPEALWGRLLPVYYIILIGAVILTVKVFFSLNAALYQRHLAVKGSREAPLPTENTNLWEEADTCRQL